VSDLERRLVALEARAEIQNLVARYAFAVDDRDMEAVAACFTEGGGFSSREGKLGARGRQAVMDQFHDRWGVLGPANHIVHQHLIELDDEDADGASGLVSSHAELIRNGEVWITAFRYEDQYRRESGRWRFADRMLSVFYYLRPQDYVAKFDVLERNLTYERPIAASIPEPLESYRAYYEAYPRSSAAAAK
jgi:ketosteroid isomerase-like protein